MYQPSAEVIIDYPSFVVNYDGQKRSWVKFKALFYSRSPTYAQKKSEGAETGFGGKSSWLNSVFGNHLINLCHKKMLKSAMITDDSLDNFLQARGFSFRRNGAAAHHPLFISARSCCTCRQKWWATTLPTLPGCKD